MEDLRQSLIRWIGGHPLGPLENELFIVQNNGMAQWLKLALAQNHGCGICAALDIQTPGQFVWNTCRAILGTKQIARESPFSKARLQWRLLKLLPSLINNDRFSSLRHYLADDNGLRKRYQLSCHLADLYDQYQDYRPDWLEDWICGSDQLRDAWGEPVELAPEQTWQAQLWRQIHADIPALLQNTTRFRLHQRFLAAAENLTQRPAKLPRRVIVFGMSCLSKQTLDVLHAISRHSQVLLFVHNPCKHYWVDIIENWELLNIKQTRHQRKTPAQQNVDSEINGQDVNPLLAAWAKQGRDYIGLLYGYDQPDKYREQFQKIDLFSDFTGQGQPAGLLRQVQQAILDLRPLPKSGEDKLCVSPQDQSISFQLAYSRQREVEILHDRLLSLFDRNTGLKPQDVIVMAPDIDTYTAHIEAVFGNLQPHDPRHIPFTIADQPERTSAQVLQAMEKLLDLPCSRMTVSDFMELLETPAFRNRFGLNEEDLPKLHQWIQDAGIRWGLNAGQRQDFDLPPGLEQNTWLFGLRRMLLGYAAGCSDPFNEIEPYDEIGGLEAALAGPLAIVLEKLENYRQTLGEPVAAHTWSKRVLDLMTDFFQPENSHEQLVLIRMQDVLDQWLSACHDAGLVEAIPLPVVRQALLGRIKDVNVSQRFLVGMVNFCTLAPMRAIPFKVVCLLGMNDGEYPRSSTQLDFNLMSAPGNYRPGDRSAREDDRYVFLEALLCAENTLYISYIGRSVQDNSERMPSVLVGQLRDYLAAGWQIAEPVTAAKDAGGGLLDHITCQHPLQPFSKTCFQNKQHPKLYTYAHEWQNVFDQPAVQTCQMRVEAPKFEGGLQLAQLIRFLKNPVKNFFNQRLNTYFDEIDVPTKNQEPFTLDHLAPFGLGMQLLNAGLSADPDKSADAVNRAAERLQRTGELPLYGFGQLAAEQLAEPVQSMLKQHHELSAQWKNITHALEIRLAFSLQGCACEVLEDWLDGLRQTDYQEPESAETTTYARWEFYPAPILDNKGRVLKPHCLISLWVKHLAGCAQGLGLTSYLVAPGGSAQFEALETQTAQSMLNNIIGHWWEGLQRPLPVTARTALAYLGPMLKGESEEQQKKGQNSARLAYQGDGYNAPGELGYADGPYLKRCFADFDAFWNAQDNEFETLAGRLYEPMLRSVK
ncbi:MAG: exodeoxyribonuclease V subunit gamma [Desulfobacteraceae bacterium]|nr:exodeoxyribonuclease V subunit gamma [Desulfobacteraceae bacterium]